MLLERLADLLAFILQFILAFVLAYMPAYMPAYMLAYVLLVAHGRPFREAAGRLSGGLWPTYGEIWGGGCPPTN